MNYYVYYSYEEYGRGYIGSRTCKCLPEEDIKYFGSSKDKTFKPTQKIILKSDYSTREEAYSDEITLQRYYKVVENPHFANRAYQTSTGFTTNGLQSWNRGLNRTEEEKKKISENRKGKGKGRKQTPEEIAKRIASRKNGAGWNKETGKKISQSLKGNTPWNKGKSVGPMDEELKKKISEAMKEKVKSRQRNNNGTFRSSV